MEQGQHQAQGLQRLFSSHRSPRIVSVLATPHASDSHEFVLGLADALVRSDQRVWLVESEVGKLSAKLGCRPLLPWQDGRPLDAQVVTAGRHGLLHAPGCMAGDAAIVAAIQACHNCDFLLFDGGRFSLAEAALEPATAQTIVILLDKEDAETAYALIKALKANLSPARVLLIGETADRLAQMVRQFMNEEAEYPKTGGNLSQISNKRQETSSNTLTFDPNLMWVVSRITKNDQPKVAHGGFGKSAKEVW